MDSEKVCMEHHFDLNFLKGSGIDVSGFIKAAEWERFFSGPLTVYPQLVREFRRNPTMTAKEVKNKVLGKEVIVSEAMIATAINYAQYVLTQEDD